MSEALVVRLGRFAAASRSDGVPEEVTAGILDHLLDTIGVAVAAVDEQPVQIVRSLAVADGGSPAATVLVTGERLPAQAAALVNGTMAHALDFDDTHLPSVIHPSAAVVPAVLAAAEAAGSSGREVVDALVVATEITCRLGMAGFDPGLKNSAFFERGLHATSICGTVGAAAGASLLLGADGDLVAHAMAIAASMGAGLLEANRTGGSVKRTHCGWAAHAGVMAARMAEGGVTGPPTVLEGRFGFFAALTGGLLSEDALVGDLGDRWEVAKLFIKPYPANHFTHAGIDAALALVRDGLVADDVVAVELGVPAPVLRTVAEPPEAKARPESAYHARFSGPFTVAAALVTGRPDLDEQVASDGRVRDLASRVQCVSDDEATDAFPYQFPAVVRVRLADGTTREHRVRHTRGGPERPLSRSELLAKFHDNVDPVLGSEQAHVLVDAIGALPGAPSLDDLARHLVSAHPT